MQNPQVVLDAQNRIQQYIAATPLLESPVLNDYLGSRILFKAESFQKTGAFKIRGALNAILQLPKKSNLVCFSSGNHAQAVALASKICGMHAKIFIPKNSSQVKIASTKSHGAEVILAENRITAEELCLAEAAKGATLIHPYDNDDIIAGQGTSCLEALQTGIKPDAIFATCGGGGWISGSYLAAKLLSHSTEVFAGEPLIANDASQSFRNGKIIRLTEIPNTIADGARTLAISERTFAYLKNLSGFYEIAEEEIVYWTQWITHLLKISCEPTSAVAMAAAFKYLQTTQRGQTILILLSGGNIDTETHKKIWSQDFLNTEPQIQKSRRHISLHPRLFIIY